MNRTALELEKRGGISSANAAVRCPECGSACRLQDSSKIYNGRSFGMAWICEKFPECDTYVGVHNTGEYKNYPLGVPANAELREAKKKAHSVFDVLWKNGYMNRGEAYNWLREKMELHIIDCHIGEMDVAQCQRVYEISLEYIHSQPADDVNDSELEWRRRWADKRSNR